MFSKRLYNLLFLISVFMRFFGACTLEFDLKRRLFKQDPTVWVNRIIKVNYNLLLFWCAGAVVSIIKFKREGDLDRFNLTVGFALNGLIVLLAFSFLRWFAHECCIIMNGLLFLMRYIHETYMPDFNADTSRYNMAVDILICLVALCLMGSYGMFLLLLVFDQTGVTYLGALVPPEHLTFPVQLFLILFHGYLLIVSHVSLSAVAGAIILYGCYVTPFYLKELRIGRAQYKTLDELRTSENVRHMYRSLQVLHAHAMQLTGLFLVFANGHFMLTCLFCNAVLISYWSDLMPMSKVIFMGMGIMVTGFWTFVLEMGRYFFQKGAKVLGSWKGGKWNSAYENKIMKKFHRSCKPILICYGTQFVIKRATVLTFLRGVVRGTFRTILLLSKRK